MIEDPLGWNYPAGAENDPSAPWNQRDEDDEDDGPTREERAIDKADRDRDLAKDEEEA